MNGAVVLHSCTSSSSRASTSSTLWLQLLDAARSGTRPPASMARSAAMRSGDADPAARASAVTACGVGDQWPPAPSGSPGVPAAAGAREVISGSGPSGSSAASARASSA